MSQILGKLIDKAKISLSKLKDHRQASAATKYKMEEAGIGALSVFIMQDASFLGHQERLARGSSEHNFKGLFKCNRIPSANQIRNLLDKNEVEESEPLYNNGLQILEETGALSQFKFGEIGHLIALDGTEYHSSQNIGCKNCTTKTKNGITTNSHSVLCATLVSPDIKEAIPLIPEFIEPQDGHEKQDCENAACKRWLSKHGKTYKYLSPTILGDDLFSRQSICQSIINEGYNFILTCKPTSHKTLYEYLNGIKPEKHNVLIRKRYKNYIFQYKFINSVPIRDGNDALLVNWLEVTQIEKKTGKRIYKNTFVTSHDINHSNVHYIASAGRARWHLENENNNTLKTKGYRFEHNYGHGKNNLSAMLASFTIVAFLYHTIMSLVDLLYIKAREANGSRINFFNMIKYVTCLLVFSSWDSLMIFITAPPDLRPNVGII